MQRKPNITRVNRPSGNAADRPGTWTPEVIRELKREFGNMSTRSLAEAMGKSYEALKKKASRLGLRKSKKYLKSLGR